jgi:general stress protein 26
MDAAYASSGETYFSNGEVTPNLSLYPNHPGDQKYWSNGEPSEVLFPFHNKENMMNIF